MAKVTRITEHDWLAVRVTFEGGQKANVTWSRNGERVIVAPHSPALARDLSLIVQENFRRLGKEGYPFANLRQTAEAMDTVGREARDLPGYIVGLRAALQVAGVAPRPKAADTAPATTTVQVRKSRGWIVSALFPNGEKAELKINASSAGLLMDPSILSVQDELIRLVFAAKAVGQTTDEQLAANIGDAARESGSVTEWVDAVRASLAPAAAGPRR